MGGHNRKTTTALKLAGTYRKDRHADRFDDSAMPAGVAMPTDLADGERESWRQVAEPILAAGYVKQVDGAALRCLVESHSVLRRRLADLRVWEATGVADADSVAVGKVLFGMYRQSLEAFAMLASRFGMTPADRAKLTIEAPTDQSDFEKDMEAGA